MRNPNYLLLILSLVFLGIGVPAQANDCTVRQILTRFQVRGTEAPGAAKRASSLDALVEEVRALFLSEISNSAFSSSEKELLRKRLLKLKVQSVSCIENSTKALGTFHTIGYVIEICDRVLEHPAFSLVVLLAHEMGHSMDLCSLSNSFYEVLPGGEVPGFQPPLDFGWRERLKKIYDSKTKLLTDGKLAHEPGAKQFLEKLIAVKKIKLIDKGIPFEHSPLTKSYRCLEKTGKYKALPDDRRTICKNFSEPGAQIWAAKVSAAYLRANFYSMSRADLISIFSLMKIETKLGNVLPPRDKEKDFNEIFLPQAIFRSSFECQSPPALSCL